MTWKSCTPSGSLLSLGEAFVTKVDSFQTRPESMMINYLDTRSASAEKRARIDLLDLKDQGLGEMHIFFGSRIVRAKSFFANPKIVQYMRSNYFIKVDKPPLEQLVELSKQFEHFDQAVMGGGELPAPMASEDINRIVNAIQENMELDPIEKGVSVLLSYHEETEPEAEEPIEDVTDELNIFNRAPVMDVIAYTPSYLDMSEDALGILLMKAPTRRYIDLLERLSGKSESHAANIAEEIIRDMEQATHYPPDIPDNPEAMDFADDIYDLIESIEHRKQHGDSGDDDDDDFDDTFDDDDDDDDFD